ncbi:MAG: HTH-type transcriptional regulator GbpR [Pseudomonadota bacterium]
MPTPASVLLNRLLARARFRHLQALVAVAELGSIRRAANAIGLTQPGVSQLLSDLEDLLGVRLFLRHARGVQPTAACLDLLPLARLSISGLSGAAEAVVERATTGHGLVRVWASTAAINGLLSTALPAFNAKHPSIQVHVREAELHDQFLGIHRNELNIGLCRQTAVVPEGWTFTPLVEDTFVVMCGPQHPLARRRRVRWRDLATATWLISPVDSAARHKLDALVSRFNQPINQCQVITRVSSMTWAMLQNQALVTLVPASVFRQLEAAGQLVRLPLEEVLPYEPLGMLLPQDVPPATGLLAAFLKSHTAD